MGHWPYRWSGIELRSGKKSLGRQFVDALIHASKFAWLPCCMQSRSLGCLAASNHVRLVALKRWLLRTARRMIQEASPADMQALAVRILSCSSGRHNSGADPWASTLHQDPTPLCWRISPHASPLSFRGASCAACYLSVRTTSSSRKLQPHALCIRK